MAIKAFSLADLNLQKQCQEAVEFKPLTASGKEMGITLSVLGAHAPEVQDWVNKALNNRRRADALNAKRNKNVDVRLIEEDIDFGIEIIAIRIVGWEGITEPFTSENALLLCRTNPDICGQVREFSEEVANFTKG